MSSTYDDIRKKLSKRPYFLFVTATDVETEALFSALKPIEGEDKLLKISKDYSTYHIGILGIYNIVHIQCGSMGSISRDASITTITEALSHWEPMGVVMVGICFGKDSTKQKIGDVLIAESIINYESEKKTLEGSISRSSIPQSGKLLLNRFKNMRTWEFKIDADITARKIVGSFLTGEKLIDNENFKMELFSMFPESIGGDMEAFGVYSAATSKGISEWIIVKGICDWADGNKSVNKKENQKLAASAAVSLCFAVFNERSFDDDKTSHGEKTDISDSIDGFIGEDINGNNTGDSDIDMFTSTTPFFDYRVKSAFPGLRGLQVIDDPQESIKRLSILLKQPLRSDKLHDPIWFFRGSSSLYINNFEVVSKTKCIIAETEELEIEKIACYCSNSYYRDFVYIQTKAEKPIGVYPFIDEEYIKKAANIDDYVYEEYGLFEGRPVTRTEYDDGGAVIDGNVVNFKGKAKLRVRYLTPYNLVICAKFHPFNSQEGDKFTKQGLNSILKGTLSIEKFAEMSLELPRNRNDYL